MPLWLTSQDAGWLRGFVSDFMRLQDKLNLSTRPSLATCIGGYEKYRLHPAVKRDFQSQAEIIMNVKALAGGGGDASPLVRQPWNPFRRRRSFSFRNLLVLRRRRRQRGGFSQQFRMEILHNESWRRDSKLLTYGIRALSGAAHTRDEFSWKMMMT